MSHSYIVLRPKYDGLFTGTHPMQAAKKAGSRILGKFAKGKKTTNVTVSRRGQDRKPHTYKVTKARLAKPVVQKRGKSTITFRYTVTAKEV